MQWRWNPAAGLGDAYSCTGVSDLFVPSLHCLEKLVAIVKVSHDTAPFGGRIWMWDGVSELK